MDNLDITIFDFFGENHLLDKLTDIAIAVLILGFAIFGIMGIRQWIKRRSLKKVDRELLCVLPSLALLAIVYVVFEKFCILNYRPILIDGVAEPSFPSTHTLIATTITLMMIMMMPKYVKSKKLRVLIDLVLVLLMGFVAFGRVASGMHWFSDVMGGLVFGIDLALVYGIISKPYKEMENE